MIKKIVFLGVLVLLMVAAADPVTVAAGGDPLASPTPWPTERITAPEIFRVNPDVVLSEGNQGDSHPSDIFFPLGIRLPVNRDLPTYVDLDRPPKQDPDFAMASLAVPFRPQEIGSVNCVQLLWVWPWNILVRTQIPQLPLHSS